MLSFSSGTELNNGCSVISISIRLRWSNLFNKYFIRLNEKGRLRNSTKSLLYNFKCFKITSQYPSLKKIGLLWKMLLVKSLKQVVENGFFITSKAVLKDHEIQSPWFYHSIFMSGFKHFPTRHSSNCSFTGKNCYNWPGS